MKSFSSLGLMLLTVGLLNVSCSKKAPVQQTPASLTNKTVSVNEPSYAVVDIDSISKNYEFCKERVKDLENKRANFSNQLNKKMNALQSHAAKFQEDYKNGKFTTQQEFESAEANLQNEQIAFQKLQEKIETDMADAMQSYQSVLQDSINNFIKDYNKKGTYKAIFSKIGNSILYVDSSIDITKEVIDGLNKRYNKKK